MKTSNHNYLCLLMLKKSLSVNECYNSLPSFEIILALVGKRDYSWFGIILLLTSECSCDELKLSYPSQEDLPDVELSSHHCKQSLVPVHADD